MAYKNGTIAFGSTGVTSTITAGFQPVYVRLTVSQKFGVTDGDAHLSIGAGTPTAYHVDSIFNDTVNSKSFESTSYVIYHMVFNGTNIVTVIEATIDSFSATGFKLNVGKANSNYNIFWEAFS